MFRRKGASLIVFVLVITLLAGIMTIPALAASEQYRIVLRFYDPIQITYTIKYPAGNIRSFPEDIPIGGVGVPGAGSFDINPFIASQIYCVDPFTPFHNNVPGVGGSIDWDITTVGAVSGYVSAAPWAMNGATQVYRDAVGWIVANGYRGIFTTSGTLTGGDDGESQQSVARLNAMFPGIGPIDKEIAVMATKVAIWKAVAGDSVQVDKTTLDIDPGRRATFDMLVDSLVYEASKLLQPGVRPSVPGQVQVTEFNISIREGADAEYDETSSAAYSYYGPMYVSASLENGSGLAGMSAVSLTASGPNSGGVRFVSAKTNNPSDELPSDLIPGTARNSQYTTGSGSGSDWESNPFYIAIPKSRTPARGDQLLISAMAMAPSVNVVDGTPIILAFAQNDVQDWDAIQAFVGGASGNQRIDMYAEDNWHTGGTSLGELYISKQVKDADEDTVDDTFTFAVYYNDTNTFDPAKRLNLTDYPVLGSLGVNTGNNTFTLKNGGLALIKGLPMVVSGGNTTYEYYYWVEEINLGQNYDTPNLVLNTGKPAGLTANGNRIGPFRLDDDGADLGFVTVTNKTKPDTPDRPNIPGDLIIEKRIEGSFADWGVDESTVFHIKIKDTTKNNYLLFKTVPEADGSYRCIGNSVDGLSEPYNGATTLELPVSVNKPLGISNLWIGAVYVIEEPENPHCDVTYIGNGAIYEPGQSSHITMTNTYEHGTGNLIINKKLAGGYGSFDVDSTTGFTIRIRNVTDGNYLMFKTTPEQDGSYWCVGNDVDGLTEDYDGPTTTQLTITAARPLVVTNLWAGLVYEIQENGGEGFEISYTGNGAIFQDDQNCIVTVTNTFEPDEPDEPDEPGRPGEPEEPGEPEIPEIPIDPNEPPGGGTSPPTGDSSDPRLAIAMILLGLGCIVFAEAYRRIRKSSSGKA